MIEEVRAALDDDLDTPLAIAEIDAAALRGEDVTAAAALLGVSTWPTPSGRGDRRHGPAPLNPFVT